MHLLLIIVLPLQECDYLRALAKPRLQTSTVVDVKTGKGIESKVRTSSGMFLSSEEKTYQVVQ
ncbi:PROLYL 4-HYDROXYLASE 1, partial [Salix koriyanagi]